MAVGAEHTKHGDGIGMSGIPSSAPFFQAGLEDKTMTAFDESGADGQTCGECGRIVEWVGSIGEVAVRDTPRRG